MVSSIAKFGRKNIKFNQSGQALVSRLYMGRSLQYALEVRPEDTKPLIFWDLNDKSTLFQNQAGTTPVTESGQPIGRIRNKAGNNAYDLVLTNCTYEEDAEGNGRVLFNGYSSWASTDSPLTLTDTDEFTLITTLKSLRQSINFTPFIEFGNANDVGTFGLWAPDNNEPNHYSVKSRGSAAGAKTVSEEHPFPHTALITTIGSIKHPVTRLRVDGEIEGQFNYTQGSGNFGQYYLNIGSRNRGEGYFSHGYLGSTIFYDKIVSNKVIAAMEETLGQFAVQDAVNPPTLGELPMVSGFRGLGSTLTCSNGTWTGSGSITYSYMWYRDGTPIPGASSSTYTQVLADDYTTIFCVVFATDENGTSSAIALAPFMGDSEVAVAKAHEYILFDDFGDIDIYKVNEYIISESVKDVRIPKAHELIVGEKRMPTFGLSQYMLYEPKLGINKASEYVLSESRMKVTAVNQYMVYSKKLGINKATENVLVSYPLSLNYLEEFILFSQDTPISAMIKPVEDNGDIVVRVPSPSLGEARNPMFDCDLVELRVDPTAETTTLIVDGDYSSSVGMFAAVASIGGYEFLFDSYDSVSDTTTFTLDQAIPLLAGVSHGFKMTPIGSTPNVTAGVIYSSSTEVGITASPWPSGYGSIENPVNGEHFIGFYDDLTTNVAYLVLLDNTIGRIFDGYYYISGLGVFRMNTGTSVYLTNTVNRTSYSFSGAHGFVDGNDYVVRILTF